MKRICLLLFVIVLMHALVSAQQGGVNTSVLPAQSNLQLPTPGSVADEFLKTDLIAQKQVEGSIAASTRKPDRLFAAFNDYRGVNAVDFILGEQPATGNLASTFFAWLFRRPAPRERPSVRAAGSAEAWVGGSFSDNGGVTWSGTFLPGGPADNSPASLASPLKKYKFEAATDPWVAAGPCGYFYVAVVAFTRQQDSAVAVMVYQDQNNKDGEHTIKYLRTGIVTYVRNASQGPFVDLPYVVVDTRRPASNSDPCAQNAYVAWMTFNGKDQSTKPSFARSLDYGATWTKTTVAAQVKTNQRAVLAVDPREGTPTTTGGGALYLGFRSFENQSPADSAMWVTRSIDFGNFFDKPVQINGSQLQAFDQRTITSDSGADWLAFRSNAYMTLAVAPPPAGSAANTPATLYAAWSERVCLTGTGCPQAAFGHPFATGDPRIVMMKASTTDWQTWKDAISGVVGDRQAIDFGDRDASSPPAAGLGYLPQPRPSGAQLQPHLVAGGDQLGMLYYESRGPLTQQTGVPVYVGGLHRHLDARFALLNPATAALLGTSQVSRYPISVDASLGNGETVDDIADVAPGVHAKAVNDKNNAPSSGGGKAPFYGDYIAATPTVTHVVDPQTKRWRWAYKAGDLPYPGARVLFADSRNVVPPVDGSGNPLPDAAQLVAYQTFQPWINPDGTPNPSCGNPGSRNHDMMHALVNSSVVMSVPTTFKLLGTIQRSFPITIANGNASSRWYRLDLVPDTGVQASFVQGDSPTTLTTIAPQLFANLLAYSSTTRPVYVASPNPAGSVRVDLFEVTGNGDQAGTKIGTAILNMDPTNTSDAAAETHNTVVSPLVTSPLVTSPLVTSSGYTSSTANPLVTSPLVTSASPTDALMTQDFSWTATGGSDIVNSAVAVQVSLKKADKNQLATAYKFEVRISRRAKHSAVGVCGNGLAAGDEQLISSIPIDLAIDSNSDPAQSPLVTSPLVTSPLVTSPLVTSPLVTSATFNMAPPDTHTGSYHDGTLHDVLDNRVYVTLRAYARVDKNNLPQLPVPEIQVQALSKNIVPNGAGGWIFQGNAATSVLSADAQSQPQPIVVAAESGGWVPVGAASKR